MATINFKQAITSVQAELKYNKIKVPVIMSYHGIGKTSIAHEIGNNLGSKVFVIEGGLLKEGELGGLPTVVGGTNHSEFDKEMEKVIKRSKSASDEEKLKLFAHSIKKYASTKDEGTALPTTVYATFWTLAAIDAYLAEDPANTALIAFDEINRAEMAVMQESMNLILAKNINGWSVDTDRVSIMAMANPSQEYEEFKDTNYNVQEFDDAQASRFTWFFVEPDLDMWLEYAVGKGSNGEQRVHPDIIEFLSTKEEFFHNFNAKEKITANPRSWEAASQVYTGLLSEGIRPNDPVVYNCLRGGVGYAAATQFAAYVDGDRRPLIRYEDLVNKETLKAGKVSDKMAEKINNEAPSRLAAAFNTMFEKIVSGDIKFTEVEAPIISSAIQACKGDTMVGLMRKAISQDYRSKVHDVLKKDRSYIEAFIEKDNLSR